MTRAAVLAQTKATVAYCNALEAMQVLQGESIDLLVLCHSLTGRQATEIIEFTHQNLPGAKILVISSGFSQELHPKGVAFYSLASSDPIGLVNRASELLQ